MWRRFGEEVGGDAKGQRAAADKAAHPNGNHHKADARNARQVKERTGQLRPLEQ